MHDHYGEAVCQELNLKASVVAWKWTIPELRNIRDALKIYYNQLIKEASK